MRKISREDIDSYLREHIEYYQTWTSFDFSDDGYWSFGIEYGHGCKLQKDVEVKMSELENWVRLSDRKKKIQKIL